ncbi:MAG: ABC transporter permease [Chloroflexi bacterium]|nr:ABC transporter permease [Chloroflexota bacterium]
MKDALNITWLYLKMTYSSRATLVFQILMPLLFTFLIGQASGGFNDTTSSTSVSWTLPVINEDAGEWGEALVAQLAADPVIDVVDDRDLETAVTDLENEDLVAALRIPAEFSETLLNGDGINLDFYTNPELVRRAQPVEQAILGAASQLSGSVNTAAFSTNVADDLGLFDLDVDQESYFSEAVTKADEAWETPPVVVQVNEDEILLNTDTYIPDGIEQSSPGMMAMFATFGMIGGAAVIIQERQNGTLRRLMVMPIRKGSIILGKLIGIFITGVVQMGILIVVGGLLFDVAWGNSPVALVLVVLAFALAITSLSMMMAALTRTLAQANALSTVIVLSISALGGAWWPLDIVPDWMQVLGRFSPMSWAMTGFHDIISRGFGVTAVLPEVGVLLIFAAVFLAIGIGRFRYE